MNRRRSKSALTRVGLIDLLRLPMERPLTKNAACCRVEKLEDRLPLATDFILAATPGPSLIGTISGGNVDQTAWIEAAAGARSSTEAKRSIDLLEFNSGVLAAGYEPSEALSSPVVWASQSKVAPDFVGSIGSFEEYVSNTVALPAYESYLPRPLPLAPANEPDPSNGPGSMVSFDLLTGQETEASLASTENLPDDFVPGGVGAAAGTVTTENEVIFTRAFNALSLVTDPEDFPWRVNVKVFFSAGSSNFVCSGALVDSSHVMTAGHCVFDYGGVGWVSDVRVVPAYENGAAFYGEANGVQLHSFTSWTANGDLTYDLGMIDLDRPIGALTGWFGYGYNTASSFYTDNTFHNPGYPAASPFNGQTMQYWYGDYDSTPTSNEARINSLSYGGQSGSNAYQIDSGGGRVVYSVLSHGTDDPGAYTDFVRMTESMFTSVRDSFIGDDTPATVDLIPMSVQVSPGALTPGGSLSSLSYLVHNYSSVAWSGTVSVEVRLSTNNIISTSDTLLETHSFTHSFTSKSTVTINAGSIAIPAGLSGGSYYVGVILNISDFNTSNNDSSGQEVAPLILGSTNFDLAPAAYSGWDDTLVISTITGTNTSAGQFTTTDTVFVDLGWANFGTTTIPANSFTTRLALDGTTVADISTPFELPQNNGAAVTDFAIGTLGAGSHTLTLTVDVNGQVAESNELNNVRTRTILVTTPSTTDFGDAPTAAQSGFAASYPTLLANNGARHTVVPGFSIGTNVDTEADGLPSAAAILDDTSGAIDDEDGVTSSGTPSIGQAASMTVFVTNTAALGNPFLSVWIDYNRDGDWDDAGELIHAAAATSGNNTINFTVPGSAVSGLAYARIRLHDGTTGLPSTGPSATGEVEDHLLSIVAPGTWIDQGPAPVQFAQVENVVPNDQVNGAIHTVLAHPTNADILYIGSVNGGVWKTTNATALNPTWVPQTDFQQSLSIGALAFDPTDATSNTLVAGTANYSSLGGIGGTRGSIYRTTDGGNTWTNPGSAGLTTFGENISGIAARGNTIVITSSANVGGIFRSINGGATFTGISSADFVLSDNFTDLIVDPSDTTGQRLYAAAIAAGGPGAIYRSDDFGATWIKVTGTAINADMHNLLLSSNNIEMAVHPTTGRLFVAVLVGGQPRGIFHSNTASSASPIWTRMDVPVLPLNLAGGNVLTNATNTSPIQITAAGHGLVNGNYVVIDGVLGNTAANGLHPISVINANTFSLNGSVGNGTYSGGGTWTRVTGPNPRAKFPDETGGQGSIHFSITVDPGNQNLVYIGGDRQEQPNVIGDNSYGGAIFRGNTALAANPNVVPSPQWDHLTHDIVAFDPAGGTANGSSPHADSREMTFDAAGNLLEVDDGGIFRRTNPQNNSGDWFSVAGTLGVVEFHDIAYDNLSNIIMGGTQDNGTQFQQVPGAPAWALLQGGDGGDVEVDNVTLAGVNRSIRYASSQFLGGFNRTTWDQNNNFISSTSIPLTPVGGSPAISPQFYTPLELNRSNPQRLVLVGGNAVYESMNQGATITQIGPGPSSGFLQDAVAYGTLSNVEALYVGLGNQVWRRTVAGALIEATTYPGKGTADQVEDVVINPANAENAFVIDKNQVFQTTDAGTTWSEITNGLAALAGGGFRTIEFIPGTSQGAIVVGTALGVFRTLTSALGIWSEVGSNLPNALVFDLQYDSTDDVLVAGMLGRGAWTLPNATDIPNGVDTTPPTVLDVKISGGTAWSTSFKNAVDSAGTGFPIPDGPGQQLDALPWSKITQIHVVFSENVSASFVKANILLTGVTIANYDSLFSAAGVSFDTTNNTGTITLNSPLGADKLRLTISDAVRDQANNQLDGEWTDDVTIGASGNMSAGGPFVYRFNVLPGDIDGSGVVLSNDLTAAVNARSTFVGGPAGSFNPRADIDASGVVLSNDVTAVVNARATFLPIGNPPSTPSAPSGASFFSFGYAALQGAVPYSSSGLVLPNFATLGYWQPTLSVERERMDEKPTASPLPKLTSLRQLTLVSPPPASVIATPADSRNSAPNSRAAAVDAFMSTFRSSRLRLRD